MGFIEHFSGGEKLQEGGFIVELIIDGKGYGVIADAGEDFNGAGEMVSRGD